MVREISILVEIDPARFLGIAHLPFRMRFANENFFFLSLTLIHRSFGCGKKIFKEDRYGSFRMSVRRKISVRASLYSNVFKHHVLREEISPGDGGDKGNSESHFYISSNVCRVVKLERNIRNEACIFASISLPKSQHCSILQAPLLL